MKQRKPNAGRHVAIERGLHPNGFGLPFRRELRQLAARLRDVPLDQGRVEKPELKGVRPCEA
jgi:hypothetical protein